MSARNHFRKHAYRWHRLSSLVIALPLMLWTVSGFLHPVMSYFKPNVASSIPAAAIDSSLIRLQPSEALKRNGIGSFRSLRVVNLEHACYYQVCTAENEQPVYLNTFDGRKLPDGDEAYATSLARRYLATSAPGRKSGHEGHTPTGFAMLGERKVSRPQQKASVRTTERITSFTSEYRASSKYLPVYRVDFEREDGLRLYVETATGKLALAMDDTRSWYVRFFAWAHTWSFLDGLGLFRNILIALFSLLCFVNGALGIYVYNLMRKKKPKGDSSRLHRLLGNSLVAFVLLFAFTGAWHSLQKIERTAPRQVQEEYTAEAAFIPAQAWTLAASDQELSGLSFARVDGKVYWRASLTGKEKQVQRYLDPSSGDTLAGGEQVHARSLLAVLEKPASAISRVSPVHRFNDRYPMSHKRLPVMELVSGEQRYYVETATGTLAAVSHPGARTERWVFSNLHMQHFWEDLLGKKYGKDVGNGLLIALTLGLMLLAATGLICFALKRMKKARKT